MPIAFRKLAGRARIHITRLPHLLWLLALAWLLLSVAIAWLDRQNRWLTPGAETRVWVKLWLFWAVWAVVPALAATVLQLCRLRLHKYTISSSIQPSSSLIKRKSRVLDLLLLTGVFAVGGWSSLIEPRTLHVHHQRWAAPAGAQTLRLALVADLHVGLYWRESQLQQLVARLNRLPVDAVVVAGDWTYEPPRDLNAAFAPLKALRHPIYGVLGNHDLQSPGANYTEPLRQALAAAGVQLIDGQRTSLRNWTLTGLDDRWGGAPQAQIAQLFQTPTPTQLVLTHQPDTAALLPPQAAFLTMAGHTHGGQIRLPWLTQRVLQSGTTQPWYLDRYTLPQGGFLMVTAGVGTIGLPARLGVPPRIDVIHLEGK